MGDCHICTLWSAMSTDSADSVEDTEEKKSYQQVSMEEGLELIKADSEYILLDVRRIDEF